jgi:hypothetical protein
MKGQLSGKFSIGQRVTYIQWSLPYKDGRDDDALSQPPAPPGLEHSGFIAGFATIRDKFYYMVMCQNRIELVLPQDINLV